MNEQPEVWDWWGPHRWRLAVAPKVQTTATRIDPDGVVAGDTKPDPDWRDGDPLIFWRFDEDTDELIARIPQDELTREDLLGRPRHGLWIERRFRVVDGDVVPTGHVEIHHFDGDPFTTQLVRALGFSDLKRQLDRQLRVVPRRLGLGPDWERASVRVKRPGRRGMSDLELAQWAERYVRALESEPRRPYAVLMERYGTSDEPDAQTWSMNGLRSIIDRARRAGLLTPTQQGRTGGELTEKAERLLARRVADTWAALDREATANDTEDRNP